MKILNWVKSFFSSQTERNEKWTTIPPPDSEPDPNDKVFRFLPEYLEVIHVNPNVYLCHRGARISVGKLPIEGSVVDRMNHISKIIGMGHESVMEHTNAIVIFKVPVKWIESFPAAFSDFLSCLKYCNIRVGKQIHEAKSSYATTDYISILVGGSARAFTHALRELTVTPTVFKPFIQEAMYATYEKCFLGPLINHGLLDEQRCTYLCDGEVTNVKSKVTQVRNERESTDGDNEDAVCDYAFDPVEKQSDHCDTVYSTNIADVHHKISQYGFTLKDAYKVSTVSFVFHDVSRTCSHQLVRHRNGITQESQRYVAHDYNKKDDFVDPILLNLAERYSGEEYKPVLEHLKRINPFKEYLYLISNKVEKEDARAWLPSNVTTKLMMTFTYENYGKFLKLRLAKGAQKEIRELAEESTFYVLGPDYWNFIDFVTEPARYKANDGVDDPLLGEFENSSTVDELVSETRISDPKSMKVETPEDAQKLFDLQEKYSKKEVEI